MAYIQGSFIQLAIFCLQVEGPITQGTYKQDSLVYLIYMYIPFVTIIASKDPQVVLVNCCTVGRSCRRQSMCKKVIISKDIKLHFFLLNVKFKP